MFALTIGLFTAVAVAAIILLLWQVRELNAKNRDLTQEHAGLKERFKGIVDIDEEKRRVLSHVDEVRARLNAEKDQARADVEGERAVLDGERQRVSAEIEEERRRARSEIESESRRMRGDLEAEPNRLQEIVGHIRANQQEALRELDAIRRRGEAEKFNLELSISKLREELKPLDEEANLRSFGFYKPRYDFATSDRYETALESIRDQQKQMIQEKTAAVCHTEWTINDNRAEGRKDTNRTLKLSLRAFNGESDASIARVRYNNVHVMEARIRKAWEAINGLIEVRRAEITYEYFDLKLQELYLAHEYQEKVQEEKEEQRRIREQMREEEIAQRELEKAKLDAEKEERRYAEALQKATEQAERAVGEKQQKLLWQVEELKRRLEEAKTNKERAIARAQMTRSGHVYIISNVGSFGEDVYKIGLTRRLDPMDRVKELGDASVPFTFDVHAIIYSEDAPALECALHRIFNQRRVNMVNARKEFFRATIDEIVEAVRDNHGEIEITRAAEAKDYRQTLALLNEARPAFHVADQSMSVPV